MNARLVKIRDQDWLEFILYGEAEYPCIRLIPCFSISQAMSSTEVAKAMATFLQPNQILSQPNSDSEDQKT